MYIYTLNCLINNVGLIFMFIFKNYFYKYKYKNIFIFKYV